MTRYRKKPVEIEAWKFDEADFDGRPNWLIEGLRSGKVYYQGGETPYLTILTLEGDHRANLGDYIIQGVKGELYPCKPDIFAMTYDEVTKENNTKPL